MLFRSIQVSAFQRIRFQREMLVSAEVVYPELFRPGLLAGWFSVEEEDIGLHTLRVENSSGQTKQRVDIAFVQELPAHGFTRAALEEDIVRHHNRH